MTKNSRPMKSAFASSPWLPGAVLAALLLGPMQALAQGSGSVQGAWVEQSLKCGDVFAFPKGRAVFKEPVNIFAPAMIITGKKLMTPQASCRLTKAVPDGNRTAVTLNCANSISHSDVQVLLAKLPDGRLARYYDSEDQSGSRYTYCAAP